MYESKMKLATYLNLKDEAEGTLHQHVIVAHRNCPDGAAAVVLAKQLFAELHYVMAAHERVEQETLRAAEMLAAGGTLLIVDIVPPRTALPKLFQLLADKDAFCGIYDHHDTTKWLSELRLPPTLRGEVVFTQTACGSKILYDCYLSKHPKLAVYADFIRYTNDRDLWLKQDPHSDELAFLHRLSGDAAYIRRFFKNPKPVFTREERTVLEFAKRQQLQREERLLRVMRTYTDKTGYRYGVVYGEGDSSELLNKALERYDLEYGLLVNLNTKRVSMRGRGNLDCAEYAAHYGGGGHKKASGFAITFQEPTF